MKGDATMLTSVADLELRLLESMTRGELLALLSRQPDLLPLEMSGDWLSRQPTSSLHMLVLAAKLIEVAWRTDRRLMAHPTA
jgi:hypothetical protein